jgi:hypothetical protein
MIKNNVITTYNKCNGQMSRTNQFNIPFIRVRSVKIRSQMVSYEYLHTIYEEHKYKQSSQYLDPIEAKCILNYCNYLLEYQVYSVMNNLTKALRKTNDS